MNRSQFEKEHWDKNAKDETWKRHVSDPEVTVEKCIKAIYPEIKGAKRVLEVGCGYGRILKPLMEKMPNSDFVGLDISKGYIKRAKEYIGDNDRYLFYCEDIRNFKRTSKKIGYHAIYSMTTFQHIDKEGLEIALKNIYKLLVKDGVFRFQFVEGEEKTEFSWQYSQEEIKEMLNKAGFKIEQINKGMIYEVWTWITATKK